ncbi:hypothetical protein [Tessaracoccus antarcticus]|uniref:Uncharacterized protein n=1 Tax=Tessaracoccus antarcticus TaxID=2479848 RepID=A0A3M0GBQ2_9ACTN|nr:hypothetical protein [Tessaracoccus antarcticus]RMB62324.1 hypothetical protein EAX62_07160 [Tessaracoccus antarcticus]
MIPAGVAARIRQDPPLHLNIVPGCTPVVFRGNQPGARIATVGINPSIREFLTQHGAEWAGPQRRFETLSSLAIPALRHAEDADIERIVQRSLDYFTGNPYRSWFDPMESLVQELFSASYVDASACHLDIVQWPTRPLWGQLDLSTRRELVAGGIDLLLKQLASNTLQAVYLNGRTVCDVVSGLIPLSVRTARFRGNGASRGFFRGVHRGALVVGCTSNLQVERLRTEHRQDFRDWIVAECRRDLAALTHLT